MWQDGTCWRVRRLVIDGLAGLNKGGLIMRHWPMPTVLRGNAPELAKEEQMATSLPSSDDVSRRASLARPGGVHPGRRREKVRREGSGILAVRGLLHLHQSADLHTSAIDGPEHDLHDGEDREHGQAAAETGGAGERAACPQMTGAGVEGSHMRWPCKREHKLSACHQHSSPNRRPLGRTG